MTKKPVDRPSFRDWVDQVKDPSWPLMPLTHITKGIGLEDILRANKITSEYCKILNKKVSFLFYGRPAYRVAGDGTIKAEAACPTCLIFQPDLIYKADEIYAFDTGAFGKRMYKHILLDEMQISDFSLEKDVDRPNKLISHVFQDKETYFDANISQSLHSEIGAEPWDFHAKAYLDLINSPGRNEPDDRICAIEIVFKEDIKIHGKLIALVVPHTLWQETKKAPWLQSMAGNNSVDILPYTFIPNKHPEYYNAKIESVIKSYYKKGCIL